PFPPPAPWRGWDGRGDSPPRCPAGRRPAPPPAGRVAEGRGRAGRTRSPRRRSRRDTPAEDERPPPTDRASPARGRVRSAPEDPTGGRPASFRGPRSGCCSRRLPSVKKREGCGTMITGGRILVQSSPAGSAGDVYRPAFIPRSGHTTLSALRPAITLVAMTPLRPAKVLPFRQIACLRRQRELIS